MLQCHYVFLAFFTDSPISVEKTTSKSAGDDKKRDQTDMATVLTRSSTAEHIHDHVAQVNKTGVSMGRNKSKI